MPTMHLDFDILVYKLDKIIKYEHWAPTLAFKLTGAILTNCCLDLCMQWFYFKYTDADIFYCQNILLWQKYFEKLLSDYNIVTKGKH